MDNTKRWLLFLIVITLVAIFFNLQFVGFATLTTTTSNVSVVGENVPPIMAPINKTLFVCEGTKLDYEFNASDLDGDILTGDLIPENPFYVFWVSQVTQNTQTFAIVSSTIDKNYPDFDYVNQGWKVHKETIIIEDEFNSTCCSVTNTTNITTIEINNPPVIEDVGVKTIYTQGDNSTFYELVSAVDTEYSKGHGFLTFNISFNGGEELFGIGGGGIIDFTANNSTTVGVHNITVCVEDTGLSTPYLYIQEYCGQDGGSFFDCDNFTLTVTNENRPPNITFHYPTTLDFTWPVATTLFLNITKDDPDGTIPDAYWYLDGVFMEKDSGSSYDNFTHNFGCGYPGGEHNVTVEITDGLVNDSLTWNITLTAVACPVDTGGGSSGGGGVGSPFRASIDVKPEFITTTILRGEGRSFDIIVKNTGPLRLDIPITIENITNMAILNEEYFRLEPGETKVVRLYLYALDGTSAGVYFGKILVGQGLYQKSVKVVLEIKNREALFDIKVTVPQEYKSVVAGEKLKVLVDLLNVGLYGTNVDIELILYMTDFNKLILYETQKETVAVRTNLSLEREFIVPLETGSGTYLILGEGKYTNVTVSTHDTFNVIGKKYLKAGYVLIILGLILLILLVLFLLYKRRKDKKERGYGRER